MSQRGRFCVDSDRECRVTVVGSGLAIATSQKLVIRVESIGSQQISGYKATKPIYESTFCACCFQPEVEIGPLLSVSVRTSSTSNVDRGAKIEK